MGLKTVSAVCLFHWSSQTHAWEILAKVSLSVLTLFEPCTTVSKLFVPLARSIFVWKEIKKKDYCKKKRGFRWKFLYRRHVTYDVENLSAAEHLKFYIRLNTLTTQRRKRTFWIMQSVNILIFLSLCNWNSTFWKKINRITNAKVNNKLSFLLFLLFNFWVPA